MVIYFIKFSYSSIKILKRFALKAKIENLERKAIGIYASFGPDKTNITDFNTQYEVLVEKLNDIADIFNLNHTSRTKNLTYLEDDAKIIK